MAVGFVHMRSWQASDRLGSKCYRRSATRSFRVALDHTSHKWRTPSRSYQKALSGSQRLLRPADSPQGSASITYPTSLRGNVPHITEAGDADTADWQR